MDYLSTREIRANGRSQSPPVLALHAFIVYALVTGLARKAVDVIKKPLEAKMWRSSCHRHRHHHHRLRRRSSPICRHTAACAATSYVPPVEVVMQAPAAPTSRQPRLNRRRPTTRSRLRFRRHRRLHWSAAAAGGYASRHVGAAQSASSGFAPGSRHEQGGHRSSTGPSSRRSNPDGSFLQRPGSGSDARQHAQCCTAHVQWTAD